ncbi:MULTISPECIES: metalloregulator ArsR/SmtB family transcription factor [unclassified Lysobacter]|uniref:ArsR/SmtB family transcription factor n=1 Tax=unclassified Lysobacter TaxID=2635362 RepID=UPI001BEB1CB1|nr:MULTISPECIES: metalloregulator ArsR/SmtB family transcription factor [unclassified Lysobacter]MBT2748735.1 helix-turn-helix transcriptional regulator [Lysobacter sp. ISL-42]MBT2751670.1 helix-turn-helix transcriptional regulator [Lysobacter sp. ISL-50]MBT2775864.1 helix-turn-helix transcriptional regulator [Lysobacter sp. ISL-54]MBT2782172.1 helix-turn-helix transcriptional regulator [Lysobacter sp. ISL-52]
MEMQNATIALAALGHTTRLAIFRLLVEAGRDGRMAGDIAEALALPGATASFHFKELSAAGLIQGESRGRFICYTANFDAMNGLIEFLTRNCCGNDASQCVPAICPPAQAKPVKRKGAVAQ